VTRFRIAFLLLGPVARATPWAAFLAGAGLGLAIVAVPAALTVTLTDKDLVTLLRAAAVCGALGVGFLLDDPAARSTATVPTPRPIRYASRAAVILPPVAAWWALVLWVTVAGAEEGIGATLPLGGVTAEFAALGAVALLPAVARLRGGQEGGGIAAFPVLLALVVIAAFLPRGLALFVLPGDDRWAAAHDRWSILLALAAAGAAWATRDPIRRRRLRPPIPRGGI
jgi:fluoroquinolone transport system permease protein